MSNTGRVFEKALVIYIDILGTQSRNDFNELLMMYDLFYSELSYNENQNREYTSYQRHIFPFSDCAYIIYDYKNKSNDNLGVLFDIALSNCEPLIMKFLSKGIVIRGGAVYGKVYYDENKKMFFGDAVNRAYQYESKLAKYPRIVLDKYIADEVIKYTKKVNKRSKLKSKNLNSILDDHVGCIVRLDDSDKQYYLNYFNTIQHGIDYSRIIKKSNKQFIDDIISMCDERITKFRDDDHVRFKYVWLKEYAEQSINNNIGKSIEYQKPFWDKVFDEMVRIDESLFTELVPLRLISNTSVSLDKKRKIFEEFCNSASVEEFKRICEMDKIDK